MKTSYILATLALATSAHAGGFEADGSDAGRLAPGESNIFSMRGVRVSDGSTITVDFDLERTKDGSMLGLRMFSDGVSEHGTFTQNSAWQLEGDGARRINISANGRFSSGEYGNAPMYREALEFAKSEGLDPSVIIETGDFSGGLLQKGILEIHARDYMIKIGVEEGELLL